MRATREEIKERVLWWLNDMAYKPPELLTKHYYNMMAEDIASTAVGFENNEPSYAMRRLDPPK